MMRTARPLFTLSPGSEGSEGKGLHTGSGVISSEASFSPEPHRCPFRSSEPLCLPRDPAPGRQSPRVGSASGSSPSFLPPPRYRPLPCSPSGSPPLPPRRCSRFHDDLRLQVAGPRLAVLTSTSLFIVQTPALPEASLEPSPYFTTEISALLSGQRRRITRCKKIRHPCHTAQASYATSPLPYGRAPFPSPLLSNAGKRHCGFGSSFVREFANWSGRVDYKSQGALRHNFLFP